MDVQKRTSGTYGLFLCCVIVGIPATLLLSSHPHIPVPVAAALVLFSIVAVWFVWFSVRGAIGPKNRDDQDR